MNTDWVVWASTAETAAFLGNAHIKLEEQAFKLELAHEREVFFIVLVIVVALVGILAFITLYYVNRKHTLALRKQNEQILKANNFKTQFIQNMSHEVRTPLNAICGFSQLLSDPDISLTLSDEERKEYGEIIKSNTELLTNLVNDVLDIGDMDSGKYRVLIQQMPVNATCRKALDTVKFRVMGSRVKLKFETELPDEYTISSDPVRVQQIVNNFLTNAIKHTQRGSITVSAKPLEGRLVRISVTDTGEGIAPDKGEAIFQRFERLNSDKEGTGLGLPICRALAHSLHGQVYLDLSYTGHGARFNLDL